MTQSMGFDVAHLLAGTLLVLSFVLLYQARITAVLNVFALQAIVLSLSVAWQSLIQNAPHLLVTAGIAFLVKGIFIPAALHRIVRRLGIHRVNVCECQRRAPRLAGARHVCLRVRRHRRERAYSDRQPGDASRAHHGA